ncbi:hypothetical protein N7527_004403 [Penicillium freii]|nr:hypothetical protein N7527_004403 [Penicillium freii]
MAISVPLGSGGAHLHKPGDSCERDAAKFDFCYYTTLPYFNTLTQDKDGYFVPPPADVRLSDRLVFLIIAHIMYPGKLHNARWPADFNTDGDIVLERWPMGDAVVLWMHGLPFLPVFSGYYLLRRSL